MPIRLLLAAILIVVGQMSLCAPASAERRIALLIGNNDYDAVTRLSNPKSDADLVASAFTQAGFDKVEKKYDLTRADLISSLRAFEDEASGADIAVIYFSGHGFEINGENYIVPTDARLTSDKDVDDEAVSLSRVLRTVEGARKLRLVILDACRDNPFIPRMSREKATKSVSKGLARVEPKSTDTLVAYAAKAGTVAWDGAGKNSPFALAVADRLTERGLDIRIALGKVRDDVLASTDNRQEPFSYGSLGGSTITLWEAPGAGATIGPLVNIPCKDAGLHWFSVQKLDRIELYKKHLELYGSCAFADLARVRVAELEKAGPAASVAPAPPADPGVASLEPVANGRPSEQDVWNMVRDSRDVGLVREFLIRHPTSQFKPDALRMLTSLSTPPATPPAMRLPARTAPKAPVESQVKKLKPATRTVTPADPSAERSKSKGCFSFGGQQYCE